MAQTAMVNVHKTPSTLKQPNYKLTTFYYISLHNRYNATSVFCCNQLLHMQVTVQISWNHLVQNEELKIQLAFVYTYFGGD